MLEGMVGEDKRVRLVELVDDLVGDDNSVRLVEDNLKLVGKVGEDRKLVVELRKGMVESKLNY